MTTADPDSPRTFSPGDVFPGAYRVVEELARGRTGAAWILSRDDGERRVASVLHRDQVKELGEWFLASAKLRASIEHPHMPRTWETGTLDDGSPYEVAELLEGESLREALTNRSVALPLPVVARILRELANALDALHARTPPLLHRALTPDNVLLTAPDGLVKLLGVGEADNPTFEAVRAGYRSPESLADVGSLTPRAEVFSFATLAYEALTGRTAFSGTADEVMSALQSGARPSVTGVRAEVPAAVDGVLQRCWALSPERRPATVGEAARELCAAMGVVDTGEVPAVPDEPTGTLSAPLRVVRRRSALLGPTVETERPPELDRRSFLDHVETTEVSSRTMPVGTVNTPPASPAAAPEAPAKSAPAKPLAGTAPKPSSPALRTAPKPLLKAPTRPEKPAPEAATLDTQKPERPAADEVTNPGMDAKPSALRHDTIDTSKPTSERPGPRAPSPAKAPSPFADDPRSTLQLPPDALAPPEKPAAPTPAPEPVAAPLPEPVATTAPTLKGLAPPAAPESLAPVTPARPSPLPPPAEAPAPRPHSPLPPPAEVTPTLPLAPASDTLPLTPAPSPWNAPAPQPVASHAQATLPAARPVLPQPAPSHTPRAPDAVAFPDEPTSTYSLPTPEVSPWRSPAVIASIFLANAIVIVGIAHAIAWSAMREPVVRVVQGPSPVCAPCAACAACPVCAPPTATPMPTPVVQPLAPARAVTPTPAARRPAGIIQQDPFSRGR